VVAVGGFFFSWWALSLAGLSSDVALSLAAVVMAVIGAPMSAWASRADEDTDARTTRSDTDTGTDVTVVGEVPAQAAGFVGRADILDEVQKAIASAAGPGVVSLVGPPGAGKTQLAAAWLRSQVQARVSVVAWIGAETEATLLDGLAAVAESVGAAPGETAVTVRAAAARRWIESTGRSVALVFDNVVDIEVVRRWLPSVGGATVVITGVRRAARDLGSLVEVGPFPPSAAVGFLAERTGLDDGSGAAAVAAELGALPLAMSQAAAVIRVEGWSYATYLDRLRSVPLDRLLRRVDGDSYERGAAEAILLSIATVTDGGPEREAVDRVLTLLSMLPAGCPRDRLERACAALSVVTDGAIAVTPDQVARALARAEAISLITQPRGGRLIQMHRLVQRVIRDRVHVDGSIDAYRQAVDYVDPDWVQRRTLTLITTVQIPNGVGVALGTLGGPLLGWSMGGPVVAGLTASCSVAGGALFALPATWLMRRYGRRPALVANHLTGALGGCLMFTAAHLTSVTLLLVGGALFGAGSTANLQSRYAAVDLARPHVRGRTLSIVVWSTTVGAIVGPSLFPFLDRIGRLAGAPVYASGFVGSATMFTASAAAVWWLMRPDPLLIARAENARQGSGQSVPVYPQPPAVAGADLRAAARIVLTDTDARAGAATVALAHGAMVAIMIFSAIHVLDGHHPPPALTGIGVMAGLHIAAMYALSPVMGLLVDHVGRRPTIAGGVVLIAGGCLVVAIADPSLPVATLGLVSIGLGWSASVVAGSTLLSESVDPADRPAVQGFGDIAMGVAGGAAAISSGFVVMFLGTAALGLLGAAIMAALVVVSLSRRTRVPVP
jgi:MFS family permease